MKVKTFLIAALSTLAPAGRMPDERNPIRTVTEGDDVGVVIGPSGKPEAGVWVIAETDDLPTKFYKIVVTDDQGASPIPDLPKANYQLWVRGYGLVDGAKWRTTPGSTVNLLSGREATPRRRRRSIPGCTGSRSSRCRRRASFRSGRCRASSSG